MRRLVFCMGILSIGAASTRAAEATPRPRSGDATPSLVRAELRTDRAVIQCGRPVWVEFCLTNLTADPLVLRVPNSPVSETVPEQMGLPLPHVFSGPAYSAIGIKDSRGETLDAQVAMRPREPVPAIHLAPFGSVGVRVDLTQHYESMRHRPGKYTLVWRPYDATVEASPLQMTLLAERQAVILTKFGKMTMRFYYDEAPTHVQNFIDLIEQRFYDNLTFHRVVPGGIVQGGDPGGDGRGTRPDGKRLHAEFSKIPFELGTVGMARSPRDPNSASSQFFICLGRQTSFDGQQTAFAYLVGDESFETLRQIAAVPTGAKDRPLKPVYIQTISLENVPARERESAVIGSSSRPASTFHPEPGRTVPRKAPPLGFVATRKPSPTSRPETDSEP